MIELIPDFLKLNDLGEPKFLALAAFGKATRAVAISPASPIRMLVVFMPEILGNAA